MMSPVSAAALPLLPVIEAPVFPDRLPVVIELVTRRRRAVARIRNGAIQITIPKTWSKAFRTEVIAKLQAQVEDQFRKDVALMMNATGPRITLDTKEALWAWIQALNAETLQAPVAKVRIGHSKYSHLAQMNLESHVMTISRHCLTDVPESALRYLVLHELAHLYVPNHSRAFWAQVRRFVPDVSKQRHLISAFHRVRVYQADCASAVTPMPVLSSPLMPLKPKRIKRLPESPIQQLLFGFLS